jgi:hypothetical protein
MICSSLNRLLRIVRLFADGLHSETRERKVQVKTSTSEP